MELKHIKELMSAMERTGTKRLAIEKDNFKLELERGNGESLRFINPSREFIDSDLPKDEELARRADLAFSRGGSVSMTPPGPLKSHLRDSIEGVEGSAEIQGSFVKSPMVGTFYATPSPDEPSLVKIGDEVSEDTIVCIIEAMKVMNEIRAGVKGKIAEILVDNSHPVEFGTPLFRII